MIKTSSGETHCYLTIKEPRKPKSPQPLHHELEHPGQALQETQVKTLKKQSSGVVAVNITKTTNNPPATSNNRKFSSETFQHNRKQLF